MSESAPSGMMREGAPIEFLLRIEFHLRNKLKEIKRRERGRGRERTTVKLKVFLSIKN